MFMFSVKIGFSNWKAWNEQRDDDLPAYADTKCRRHIERQAKWCRRRTRRTPGTSRETPSLQGGTETHRGTVLLQVGKARRKICTWKKINKFFCRSVTWLPVNISFLPAFIPLSGIHHQQGEQVGVEITQGRWNGTIRVSSACVNWGAHVRKR